MLIFQRTGEYFVMKNLCIYQMCSWAEIVFWGWCWSHSYSFIIIGNTLLFPLKINFNSDTFLCLYVYWCAHKSKTHRKMTSNMNYTDGLDFFLLGIFSWIPCLSNLNSVCGAGTGLGVMECPSATCNPRYLAAFTLPCLTSG